MHTYRVVWQHDCEAETPEDAARQALARWESVGGGGTQLGDFPIFEVRQFIDDGEPPLCVNVDTLDWSKDEEWYDYRPSMRGH